MLPEGADLPRLIELRRQLHRHPELSGNERRTAATLIEFLSSLPGSDIWTELGGQGLAARFHGSSPGRTVLLRAELDALPIPEKSSQPWASLHHGISHACGHDGHMTILAGVAQSLAHRPPECGQVVLLFQPAEETGAGARAVAEDPRMQELAPDRLFALHNLPGYPLGTVLVRPGAFCAGSAGLTVRLTGQTSHAAYPEQGRSPDQALAEIVTGLTALPIPLENHGHLALVTVGHARLGQPAFGITPGEAEIMATLRSDDDGVLDHLKNSARDLASRTATRYGLEVTCTWSEEFPVTSNDDAAAHDIEQAARRLGLECQSPDESPFRWSEDFGHLLELGPGAMFGLGSGREHPPLHAEDFDFPEEILGPGLAMLTHLARATACP